MIKKYTYLVSAFLLSFALVSEETGRHEMHAFYFMQVSNPPAIVGAIDKFASSECGKKFPADMTLMAETINGSSPATHFLILSFETRADFQKAGQLANSCPEAAAMLQSMHLQRAAVGWQPFDICKNCLGECFSQTLSAVLQE